MKEQLKTIENKLMTLKSFRDGSELTIDVNLSGLNNENMEDIAGFFEFKSKARHKAFSYLKKMQHKYK